MKKKLLSVLLAMVLLLTCIPMGTLVVSAAKSGGYEYTVSDGTATITGYTGSASKLSIPSKLGGYPVTDIGWGAFKDNSKLISVSIPDGVVTINSAAFSGCTKLKKITIGKSVENIFKYDHSPFSDCSSLTAIEVSKNNPYFSSENGVLFNKKKTMLFLLAPGKSGSYKIPSTVKTIDGYAFECSKLTSVTVPKNVTCIKQGAFSGCLNLKSLTLPFVGRDGTGKLVSDGWGSYVPQTFGYIFENGYVNGNYCAPSSLKTVIITGGKVIDEEAFSGCRYITTLVLPKTITTVKQNAFSNIPSLKAIKYMGSQKQAKNISIAKGNDKLKKAKWTYNYVLPCETAHTYKKMVTKATATANGSIKNVCTKCGYTASKVTTIYKVSKVKLSKTTYTYNGKVQKPTVTVKDSKGKTISSSCYTVKYASGRKNVGTYKVTITFKGKYKGTKTLTFKIVPRTASINKLTAKSKAISVKLNRSLKQSSGYQIQYSTSSSFKIYKTKWITDYTKNSKTLSELKSKTTYYVRVRTYKKVGDTFYYSNWSTAKRIKTK